MRIDEAKLRDTIRRLLIENFESAIRIYDYGMVTDKDGEKLSSDLILAQDAEIFRTMIQNLQSAVDVQSTGFGQYFEVIVSKLAQAGKLAPMGSNVIDLNAGDSGNFEFADISTNFGGDTAAVLYSCKMSSTVDLQTGTTKSGTLYKGIMTAVESSALNDVEFFVPGYVSGWPNDTITRDLGGFALVINARIISPAENSGIRILNGPFDTYNLPRIAIVSGDDGYILNAKQTLNYLSLRNKVQVDSEQQVINKIFQLGDDEDPELGSVDAKMFKKEIDAPTYFESRKDQTTGKIRVFLEYTKSGGPSKQDFLGYVDYIKFIDNKYMGSGNTAQKTNYKYKHRSQLTKANPGPITGVRAPLTPDEVTAGVAPRSIGQSARKWFVPGKNGLTTVNPGDQFVIGSKTYTMSSDYSKFSGAGGDTPNIKEYAIGLTPYDKDKLSNLLSLQGKANNPNSRLTPDEMLELSMSESTISQMVLSFLSDSARKAILNRSATTGAQMPDQSVFKAKDRITFKPSSADIGKATDPKVYGKELPNPPTQTQLTARINAILNSNTWLGGILRQISNAFSNQQSRTPSELQVPTDPNEKQKIEEGMVDITTDMVELETAWSLKSVNPKPFLKRFVKNIARNFPDVFDQAASEIEAEREEAKKNLKLKTENVSMQGNLGEDLSPELISLVTQLANYLEAKIISGETSLAIQKLNEIQVFLSSYEDEGDAEIVQFPGMQQQQAMDLVSESKLYESIIRKLLAASKKRR